jgi:archaellum component FlaC
MTDTDERFDRLEAGLDKVEGRLDKVEDGLAKVEGRLGRVEGEVQKLRVLGEENTQQLKLIAEVQSHHGSLLEQHSRLLDQLVSDVQPLKVLPDLLRTVIQDHERRIAALEKQP